MRAAVAALITTAVMLTACADEPAETSSASTAAITSVATAPTSAPTSTVDPTVDRPFEVVTPATYDGSTPLPLILLLHGFGITGAMQDETFDLSTLADSRNFLLVTPDGSRNADGDPFWNATDACCGFGETVDDSAYLAAVIAHVQADYSVDPRRISIMGFSNGGFMSYRMACDHADLIASLVSISAATFSDPTMCAPSATVNVVEIHGTKDETIPFDGGTFESVAIPSAEQTVDQWSTYNACTGSPTTTESVLDLDASLTGNESAVTRFEGCPLGGDVQLWTIPDAGHIPAFSTTFSDQVIDYLLSHPKV